MAAVQNTWMPPRPVPQQPAPALNRSQRPGGAAEHLTKQLQSNPAFMRSLADKFKISSSRETGSGGVGGLASAFTDHSSEGGEFKIGSEGRLHAKSEMANKMRRAVPGSLRALAGIAPTLGDAAGSPRLSAEIGEKAGLKGQHNGCGVLGALVQKELGLGRMKNSGRPGAAETGKKDQLQKAQPLFLNQVHSPVMLGPTPAPRPRELKKSPEATGRQMLSDCLKSAGGKIGELLQGSELGKMVKLAEGLPTALALKATERLKHERFFLAF
jgi:hypothetical protein